MNCMKCKREIEEGQVFCPVCLEEMVKHPVNSNTAIRLPRRPDAVSRRMLRRKTVSEEEQIRSLKLWLRIMTWLFAVCLVLLIALSIPAVQHLIEQYAQQLPGQNYSSATQPAEKAD